MRLLKEYRKKNNFLVKNAAYNLKEAKKIKKAVDGIVNKEESMRNWISTIVTVLTVIVSGLVFTFTAGKDYQEIKMGISQNSKQLSELIHLNKTTISKVTKLERRTDKIEIYQNLNKERIKKLEEK